MTRGMGLIGDILQRGLASLVLCLPGFPHVWKPPPPTPTPTRPLISKSRLFHSDPHFTFAVVQTSQCHPFYRLSLGLPRFPCPYLRAPQVFACSLCGFSTSWRVPPPPSCTCPRYVKVPSERGAYAYCAQGAGAERGARWRSAACSAGATGGEATGNGPGLCVRQNLGELGEWTCFGFGE